MGEPNYTEINVFRYLIIGDWTEIYWSCQLSAMLVHNRA
jgi:hypothetical protein